MTWILPSKIVAQCVSETHQLWLAKRGRLEQKHNDHSGRRLLPDYPEFGLLHRYQAGWLDAYLNNWDSCRKMNSSI